VEFALVAPLLILLVFGIIDFGLMINEKTVLANAAREGARNGSISHSESVVRSTVNGALGSINPSEVTTTVTCKTPSGATCGGSFDSAVAAGGTVVVTVKHTYSWITPVSGLLGLGSGTTLSKTVEMRVE
jgi:Flp pilus assembly protein TadG